MNDVDADFKLIRIYLMTPLSHDAHQALARIIRWARIGAPIEAEQIARAESERKTCPACNLKKVASAVRCDTHD